MFLLDLVIGARVTTGVDGKFLGDNKLEGESVTLAGFQGVCVLKVVVNGHIHA
jgi:hypothetical protein